MKYSIFVWRYEIVIASLVLLVSGGLFLFVWNTVGLPGLMWGGNDFIEYDILARNVLEGHGFSLRNAAPYEPSATRTPGYPLFLAFSHAISGSTILASVFQIFLFVGVGVLSYRILLMLGLRRGFAFGGALFTVFEPDVISMSLYLVSDMLFVFFVLFSLYLFLKFVHENDAKYFLWASLAVGASAIVRPVGLVFLGLYLIGFLIVNGWKWKEIVFSVILATLFLIPWSARNYSQFGTWRISSADTYNLYTVMSAQIVALRDGVPYGDAREKLLEDFLADPVLQPLPVVKNIEYNPLRAEFLLADNFKYDSWMNERVREIFWSSPVLYLKVISFGVMEYFTQVNWLTPLEHWDLLHPSYRPTASVQQLFFEEGVGSALAELSRRFSCGFPCILFFGLSGAGRIFWAMLSVLAVAGATSAYRSSSREIRQRILYVLCFAALLAAVHIFFIGAQVQPRYRMASVPIFSGFALMGIWTAWSWFSAKIRATKTLAGAL